MLAHVKKFLSKPSHPVLLNIVLTTAIVAAGFSSRNNHRETLVFLPGTQVGTVSPTDNVIICEQCHYSASPTRPVTIYSEWAGSMMAQSARDPIFFAALAVANKYNTITGNATGEYCIRCHTPMGWLAGHSEDFTGQSIAGTDFDGVQCDYCHRLVDPLNPDTTVPYMSYPVPGYGNGMHVVQRYATPKRGPFDTVSAPHSTMYYAFQEKSELCGICHDVSNPYYAQDRITQAPYQYAPLERTYSEWYMSWYATQGEDGTCQSCHMRDTSGFTCVYNVAPFRDKMARHDLTGGNTFVPDILPDFWSNLDTAMLGAGKHRAVATLQRAADLKVDAYKFSDTVYANVRVTNLTGHKLPTGYPDGRRMWLNIEGKDVNGTTTFKSGVYNPDSATLINDNQIKVYEMIQGLTQSRADAYGLTAGATLHFALNDTILFDNRIPPKGFTNAGFMSRLAQPVGVTYEDSQYWDITTYLLPKTTTEVTATLYYQTISKEYIDFLRSENNGNPNDWNSWGEGLFTSWQEHGRSEPVVMNSESTAVHDTTLNVVENQALPSQLNLMQNYPNPFNPVTTISFVIGHWSFVSLKVFDLLGHEVSSIVNEMKPAGRYEVVFDASNLASGMYFYTLSAGEKNQTKKLLLIR